MLVLHSSLELMNCLHGLLLLLLLVFIVFFHRSFCKRLFRRCKRRKLFSVTLANDGDAKKSFCSTSSTSTASYLHFRSLPWFVIFLLLGLFFVILSLCCQIILLFHLELSSGTFISSSCSSSNLKTHLLKQLSSPERINVRRSRWCSRSFLRMNEIAKRWETNSLQDCPRQWCPTQHKQ